MTTPERKVKKQAMEFLKAMGAYWFYPVTGGYGKSGVPDIVGCWRGQFFGIECKAGRNKPTALQLKNLKEIQDAGGVALIVNEGNVKQLPEMLEGIEKVPEDHWSNKIDTSDWEQLEFDFGEKDGR
jgi:hypothetical protein